jgi:hypothetical protein
MNIKKEEVRVCWSLLGVRPRNKGKGLPSCATRARRIRTQVVQ